MRLSDITPLKIMLIPLTSLAVVGAAALLTHETRSPSAPAPVCVDIKPFDDTPVMHLRFSQPPPKPVPAPRPAPAPVA